jgi:Sec-independent protein translocase protein TatA
MHFLGVIFFLIFGGRLIRFLIRTFGSSLQDREEAERRYREQQNQQNQQDQTNQDAQEAYRRWQEEMYRRYRESQYQYQQQQQQYNQYYRQTYRNTAPSRPEDPKLTEVRRMYGHPQTLDELDDKQRELRKKYHPDNYNGDSSMFILVDQVHDELERNMKY